MELMDLANSMNQEEQRYVREGFSSDEELSMYDMLFNEDLSKDLGIVIVKDTLLILVSHCSPIKLKYNSSTFFNGSFPILYLYLIV